MLSMADDLGFSQTQLKSIGMLVHALYNNPKVLYAPNNTAANLIIGKVGSVLFTKQRTDSIVLTSRSVLEISFPKLEKYYQRQRPTG